MLAVTDNFLHSIAMTSPTMIINSSAAPLSDLQPRAVFSDPLLVSHWHLLDASGAIKGANVIKVWDDYRGTGVLVAVIDDGFDYTHPDLAANYALDLDYDAVGLDADAYSSGSSDRHGTTVAGVIAASLDNAIGGSGVAPEATLIGYRIGFGASGSMEQLYDVYQRIKTVDVVNNSWGFEGFFGDNFFDPELAPLLDSLRDAMQTGRGGLGTVVVFSAGNGRAQGQDVNYHSLQNDRGIITVAATDSAGNAATFSTPGAALLLAAPGVGITTTDRVGTPGYTGGDYATQGGTSYSSPLVSGVVALMLDANAFLGWRDVQEILAATAVQTGNPASWSFNGASNWNGGGMHVSHDFGFGLVDAYAAVRVAESWRDISVSANEMSLSGLDIPNVAIPDQGSVSRTVTLADGVRIDHVEVEVILLHANIGQLQISLISPDGTQSLLMHNPGTSQANLHFTFATTRDWGEQSGGDWTLIVTDSVAGIAGSLLGWELRVYGDPSGNDTYVYTEEFSTLATADPTRLVLSDLGGTDTINTAAIASNTLLDLRPGLVSSIDGQTVTLAVGSLIENADSGDGNDVLIGNDNANWLRGWRGSDTLDGGTGDDTLDGGAGADTMTGGGGNDLFFVDSAGDRVIEAVGEGDDTVLTMLAKYVLGAQLENLLYTGAAGFNGTGNSLANLLGGGVGNDTLNGGAGGDILIGGMGNDSYTVDNTGDSVFELAGEGNDIVYSRIDWTLGANLERLSLTGSSVINATGNELANTLQGNANSAANVLTGGLGNDSYYVGLGDSVVELPNEGIDTVYSVGDYSLAANVEKLFLNVATFATLTGNELANTLRGNAGGDTLLGLAGNDSLTGGWGADTMHGGLGDDSYTVDNPADNVFELSGEGNDIVNSSIDWTLGANLERIYLTGNTAINASGNELANVLYGNASSAANILAGGLGNDSYYVGVGDSVVELENEGSDIVYSAFDWTLGANIERISLTGTAAVSATGNGLANTLQGNANSAANVLAGGLGNDSYYVGVGDSVVELLNEGIDTVYSYGNHTLSANVEKLLHNVAAAATLTGNDLANTLRGNVGNDTLLGLAGNDTLTGGLGDDFLFGGAGDDVLVGSAGFDHFVFEGVFGKDRVNDFVLGQDLIQLSGVTGIAGFGDLDTNLDTFLDAGDTAVQMLGADMLLVFGGDQIRIVGQAQLHSLDFVFA